MKRVVHDILKLRATDVPPTSEMVAGVDRLEVLVCNSLSREALMVPIRIEWTGARSVCLALFRVKPKRWSYYRSGAPPVGLTLEPGTYRLNVAALDREGLLRSVWRSRCFELALGSILYLDPFKSKELSEKSSLIVPELVLPLPLAADRDSTLVELRWRKHAGNVLLLIRNRGQRSWQRLLGGSSRLPFRLPDGDYSARVCSIDLPAKQRSHWSETIEWSISAGDVLPIEKPQLIKLAKLTQNEELCVPERLGLCDLSDLDDDNGRIRVGWQGGARGCCLAIQTAGASDWSFYAGQAPFFDIDLRFGDYRLRACALDFENPTRSAWSKILRFSLSPKGMQAPRSAIDEIPASLRAKDVALAAPEWSFAKLVGLEENAIATQLGWNEVSGQDSYFLSVLGENELEWTDTPRNSTGCKLTLGAGVWRIRLCAASRHSNRRGRWSDVVVIRVVPPLLQVSPGGPIATTHVGTLRESSDLPVPENLNVEIAIEERESRIAVSWSPTTLPCILRVSGFEENRTSYYPALRSPFLFDLADGCYEFKVCSITSGATMRSSWSSTKSYMISGTGAQPLASRCSPPVDCSVDEEEKPPRLGEVSTQTGIQGVNLLCIEGFQSETACIARVKNLVSMRVMYFLCPQTPIYLALANGRFTLQTCSLDRTARRRSFWSSTISVELRDGGIVQKSFSTFDLFPQQNSLPTVRPLRAEPAGSPHGYRLILPTQGALTYGVEITSEDTEERLLKESKEPLVDVNLRSGIYRIRTCTIKKSSGRRSGWSMPTALRIHDSGWAEIGVEVPLNCRATFSEVIDDSDLVSARLHAALCRLGASTQIERPLSTLVITGAPRTGTTLMQNVMCSAPNATPFLGEAAILRYLCEYYRRTLAYHNNSFGDYFENTDSLNEYFKNCAEMLFDNLRRRYGAIHCILKEPELTKNLPLLSHFIPNAGFLVMVRDPRAAIASMIEWGQKARQSGRQHFFQDKDMVVLTNHMKSFYAPLFGSRDPKLLERLRYIRYEDFVVNPRAAVAELQEFSGLDLSRWSPKKNWPHRSIATSRVSDSRLDAITPLYGKPVSKKRLDAYIDILTEEEIAEIEVQAKTFMTYFNYI